MTGFPGRAVSKPQDRAPHTDRQGGHGTSPQAHGEKPRGECPPALDIQELPSTEECGILGSPRAGPCCVGEADFLPPTSRSGQSSPEGQRPEHLPVHRPDRRLGRQRGERAGLALTWGRDAHLWGPEGQVLGQPPSRNAIKKEAEVREEGDPPAARKGSGAVRGEGRRPWRRAGSSQYICSRRAPSLA